MDKIFVVCLAALATLSCAQEAKHNPPKVQVYSFQPGQYGQDNTLICHVSNFHPPDITIQLMKNGQEIPNAKLTDLAFANDWHFHLTKNVAFTPQDGEKYSCKVTHGKTVKEFAWVSNM